LSGTHYDADALSKHRLGDLGAVFRRYELPARLASGNRRWLLSAYTGQEDQSIPVQAGSVKVVAGF
jgi:hypothetical protein